MAVMTCMQDNGLPDGLPDNLNPIIKVCSSPPHHYDYHHSSSQFLKDAIKKKICTYFVTGKKAYGQLFYALPDCHTSLYAVMICKHVVMVVTPWHCCYRTGQKPVRVCSVCAELCIPKFNLAIQKPIFAGRCVVCLIVCCVVVLKHFQLIVQLIL